MAYFAPEEVHNLIQKNNLKTGAEIQLTKKGKAVEFAIIGQATAEPVPIVPASASTSESDNLKAILLQCVKDAAEVIRDSGIQLGNDELQKLATTLFIQRAKNAS
jgi:DNA-binding protein YbaB